MGKRTSELEKAIKTIKLIGDDDVIRSLLKLDFKTSGILKKNLKILEKKPKAAL